MSSIMPCLCCSCGFRPPPSWQPFPDEHCPLAPSATPPRRTQHAELQQQLQAAHQHVTDLQQQLQERQQECGAAVSSSREQAAATKLLQQQVWTTKWVLAQIFDPPLLNGLWRRFPTLTPSMVHAAFDSRCSLRYTGTKQRPRYLHDTA